MTPETLDPMRVEAHPSLRSLESFAAGDDVPTTEAQHLGECHVCRERIDGMRSERQAFLRERPASPFVAQVRARADRAPSWSTQLREWMWRQRAVLVLGAAAAATASVLLINTPLVTTPTESTIQLKGNASPLTLLVSRNGAPAEPWDQKSALAPGDVIKLLVNFPRDGYAAVLNRDGKGVLTVYHAPRGRSEAVTGGSQRPLGPSIELDNFIGEEHILVAFSRLSLDVQTLRTELEKKSSTDVEWFEIVIQKATRGTP